MAFTTAQQDRMDKILIEEPDIAVNRLKNIIGSTNWTAVKNYIGVFKREAVTEAEPEARHDSIEAFPISLETEPTNVQMLKAIVAHAQTEEENAIVELNYCVMRLAYAQELLSMELTGHSRTAR